VAKHAKEDGYTQENASDEGQSILDLEREGRVRKGFVCNQPAVVLHHNPDRELGVQTSSDSRVQPFRWEEDISGFLCWR